MSDWSNRGKAFATDFHEIHIACRQRQAERVRALLESGVDPNIRNELLPNGDGNNTPLWFAVQGRQPADLEILEQLIRHGADINAQGEYGTTALHIACAWGQLEAVKYLVGKGADLAIQDADGLTPGGVVEQGYEKGGEKTERLWPIKEYLSSRK
jgi:ankyrin repeat protein